MPPKGEQTARWRFWAVFCSGIVTGYCLLLGVYIWIG